MTIAKPAAGASNGDLVRWTFEVLDAHDASALRTMWNDATGKAVAVDGMDHFVIRDGTIATNFVVFDQMRFARQIGLLAAAGSRGDRATKAAFNARTRLLARVRDRRRR